MKALKLNAADMIRDAHVLHRRRRRNTKHFSPYIPTNNLHIPCGLSAAHYRVSVLYWGDCSGLAVGPGSPERFCAEFQWLWFKP
jgi:hypothetical protein